MPDSWRLTLQALRKPYLLSDEGCWADLLGRHCTNPRSKSSDGTLENQPKRTGPLSLWGPGRASTRAESGFYTCHIEQALKNKFVG